MKKLEKGFTLIELMIVVAIIAILAAVAAPKFGQQIKKAKDAQGLQVVGVWRSALTLDYADSTTETYATQFATLADNVDAGTLAKTFTTYATTVVGHAGNTAWVKVGTNTGATTTTGGKAAIFGFDSASTTDNAINFTAANGKDTKGTSWSAY